MLSSRGLSVPGVSGEVVAVSFVNVSLVNISVLLWCEPCATRFEWHRDSWLVDKLRSSTDTFVHACLVGMQQQAAYVVLCAWVVDGPEQREVLAVAVNDELTRRERHALARAIATFPDREAHEFQSREFTAVEVDLRVGELAGRLALFVQQ